MGPADALLLRFSVDAISTFSSQSPGSTMQTVVYEFYFVEIVGREQGQKVRIVDGLGARHIGHIFFVYIAFDVASEVNFPPFTIQVDDGPGVSQGVAVQGTTRDAQFTAHDGKDVDEVVADTSMSIVDAPGASKVVIIACTPLF